MTRTVRHYIAARRLLAERDDLVEHLHQLREDRALTHGVAYAVLDDDEVIDQARFAPAGTSEHRTIERIADIDFEVFNLAVEIEVALNTINDNLVYIAVTFAAVTLTFLHWAIVR